jgi:hypothetical protein
MATEKRQMGTVKEVSETELKQRLSEDDRRGAPRLDARMEVEVPLANWEQFRRVYTKNISQGGLMFELKSPATVPAALNLVVTLPDGSKVTFESEVRHVMRRADGPDYEVGVQFRPLDPAVQTVLDSALNKFAK